MSDDKHIRRSGEDYVKPFAALLPQGIAWPKDNPESTLYKLLTGLAKVWGFVDGRAADLLERETDPRITLELLDEWERAFGLPDPCLNEPLTIADRQIALVNRITTQGGQSRQFFIDLAASIGYTIEQIREFSPFMMGISELGDTRLADDIDEPYQWEIGAPEMRFYWVVRVGATRLTWWRTGQAELGVDPHLRIGLATDLECIFNRYKPAHTRVLFDYTSMDALTVDSGLTIDTDGITADGKPLT